MFQYSGIRCFSTFPPTCPNATECRHPGLSPDLKHEDVSTVWMCCACKAFLFNRLNVCKSDRNKIQSAAGNKASNHCWSRNKNPFKPIPTTELKAFLCKTQRSIPPAPDEWRNISLQLNPTGATRTRTQEPVQQSPVDPAQPLGSGL